MGYNDTFNNLMTNINPANITENTFEKQTITTVYEDFRLTVTNEMFNNVGLNEAERIIVYVNNNQNVIYLTDKNSLGEDFGIIKILKHTPNKGIRLNIGKLLNIGNLPCEVKIQIENGMIKIYPTNGIQKLPANKAFEKINNTIKDVYGFDINQFLDRLEKGVI